MFLLKAVLAFALSTAMGYCADEHLDQPVNSPHPDLIIEQSPQILSVDHFAANPIPHEHDLEFKLRGELVESPPPLTAPMSSAIHISEVQVENDKRKKCVRFASHSAEPSHHSLQEVGGLNVSALNNNIRKDASPTVSRRRIGMFLMGTLVISAVASVPPAIIYSRSASEDHKQIYPSLTPAPRCPAGRCQDQMNERDCACTGFCIWSSYFRTPCVSSCSAFNDVSSCVTAMRGVANECLWWNCPIFGGGICIHIESSYIPYC